MKTLAKTLLPLLALCAGCSYSNSTDSQAFAPISRLETDPPGARVLFTERNLMLKTPADLNYEIDPEEPLEVTLSGYRTWRGALIDLPRTADKTYRLELQPLR